MNVVAAAVDSVVPKLLQLLGDEYNLQRGVKKEVQSLSDELRHIHAFLCNVSEVPWDQLDKQVKEWASDIREKSYDMEDILDTFLVRVEGRETNDDPSRLTRAMKKMANVFSFSKWKARHDVGSAIRDIMKQLEEVADRRARYRIDDLAVNSAATTSTTDPRLKAMYNEVASLVGVDEPSKDLISKLSARADDMARRRKIVAVVGIGGLGKTTLAKAVYDKIRADFECGAFVPVGRNPNLPRLLMDILYELDKNKFAYTHTKERRERQLIDNLREFLADKRYFIVIDDIWEDTSWKETIELALLENNRGSRIIITTRIAQVAKEIGDEVYKMQPLSNGNSKKLFYTRIFGAKEKWPHNEPDEISEKILKKCDGVPLAIITMASLLVGKPREKWSDVFTRVGFGRKDDKVVDNTMKILSFSYYDLPAYLRTCLLYLSVYPEDYMIDKESLIWKWIAEGFIQGKQGIWLFELGEQYFNDLVNRSMIQAVEFDEGMVYSCRVHDMVLDLIRSISSEQNFVTILDNDEGTVSPPPRTPRRLALHGNTMENTAHGNMKDGMPQVRSFIAFRCAFGSRVKLSSFKLLRVLDMERCKNVRPSHLVHLENLLHLRYLGLEGTDIDELPNEIGALKLLQTLNLVDTGIRQLTPSISQLTQLVCLKGRVTLAPNWIGKLTSLEELQVAIYFRNDNQEDHARGFLKALGSLRELRVLDCEVFVEMDESMQRDLWLSLCNLHKLRHLYLWGPCYADTTVWGEAGFVLPRDLRILHLHKIKFSCLPPCIGAACLPNLTRLTLHVDVVDQKFLEFLGRLPELCYLSLDTKSTVAISNINTSNSHFQKLRFCRMPWSMIQFQCKEEDSSVSFHVWNGIDAMPFGSSKIDCSREPYAVMPNLELLDCAVFVRALKDGKGDSGNIGLEYLPSLRRVEVNLDCEGASAVEVDEAEAALRKATEVHPNRPMLDVDRWNEDEMISEPEDDDVSSEGEDQKQQEGEPTADEGVTKSSILNS